MNFNVNDKFLYLLAGGVIVFVILQSSYFLVKAIRSARQVGMDMNKVKHTVITSGIFTIAPALPILLGVISLSKFLGTPLPWMRLSILGAITYELTAAASAASSVGLSLADSITNGTIYATIVWVMTIGIIPSVILIPIFLKKIQSGISTLKNRDVEWGEHMMTSIFLGMISAFLGVVFKDIRLGIPGLLPVFVLAISAIIMSICGLIIKKKQIKWIEDYALPFSIIGGMASAVFYQQMFL